MSWHDDHLHLQQMLDYGREVIGMTADRRRDDLDADRMFELALVRLLEMIGEAANRVSEETQSQHTQVAWAQIIGLRNRLIHGYDSVDFDILWNIVTKDIPPFIRDLEAILS